MALVAFFKEEEFESVEMEVYNLALFYMWIIRFRRCYYLFQLALLRSLHSDTGRTLPITICFRAHCTPPGGLGLAARYNCFYSIVLF